MKLTRVCSERKRRIRFLVNQREERRMDQQELMADLNTKTQEIDQRNTTINDLRQELEQVRQAFTNLERAKQRKDAELGKLKDTIKTLETDKSKLQENARVLNERVRELRKRQDLSVPQTVMEKIEFRMKQTAVWFSNVFTDIKFLFTMNIVSLGGISMILLNIRNLPSQTRDIIIRCLSVWMLLTSFVSVMGRRELQNLLDSMDRRFATIQSFFMPFALLGMLYGSIMVSNFIEAYDTWDLYALIFYVLVYIHLTVVLKTYGRREFFGANDCILTISTLLAVKLKEEEKIGTAVFWVYMVMAVIMLFYKRLKAKLMKEKTKPRDEEREA